MPYEPESLKKEGSDGYPDCRRAKPGSATCRHHVRLTLEMVRYMSSPESERDPFFVSSTVILMESPQRIFHD